MLCQNLSWNQLSFRQQQQAVDSYISLMADCAVDGDIEDFRHYNKCLKDRQYAINHTKTKNFDIKIFSDGDYCIEVIL